MAQNDQRTFGYLSAQTDPKAVQSAAEALPPWVFAKVVDHLTIAVCLTDTDANILYVNPAFTEVTGYAASEVIGQNTAMLSDRCTPARVYDQLWRQIKRGKPWTGLLVNRRKRSTVYLAELTVIPIQDLRAETACFLGIHRDVTAMHHLEQQVHYQKALIESMVDAAPAVIALLDENGRVILDNHEYKKLVGDLRVREPAAEFLRACGKPWAKPFRGARTPSTVFGIGRSASIRAARGNRAGFPARACGSANRTAAPPPSSSRCDRPICCSWPTRSPRSSASRKRWA